MSTLPPITDEEIKWTQITVSQFTKVNVFDRLVGLKVTFEEDTEEFTTVVSGDGTKRNKMWYIRRAANALKKQIKTFIKTRDQTIIGTQIAFESTYWSTD